MTVKIQRVREAQRLIEADIEWLERQVRTGDLKSVSQWVDALDFGCPKNLKKLITTYQETHAPQIATMRETLQAELTRLRNELAVIEETIDATPIEVSDDVAQYVPAEDWVQPQGAHDAYPLGAIVAHDGAIYRSRRDANVWEPGTSDCGWLRTEPYPSAWYHLGNEGYPLDWEVYHNDTLWRSTMDNNHWEPPVHGWEQVMTQEGLTPDGKRQA